jgi:hypothetical protein
MAPSTMQNKFNTALAAIMYITFSLGSLPESVSDQDVLGGLFVIGIYENKPKIDKRIASDSIFIGMIEL